MSTFADNDKVASLDWNGAYFILTVRNEITTTYNYLYSPDGYNWSTTKLPTTLTNKNPYVTKSVGDRYLIAGDMKSAAGSYVVNVMDGNTQNLIVSPSGQIIYDIDKNIEFNNTITFPRSTLLALGGVVTDSYKIAYSYDQGFTWSPASNSAAVFSISANSAAWNGRLWVAAGSGGNTLATSLDGNKWTGRGSFVFSQQANGVKWSDQLQQFVAVGSDAGGNTIATSQDGVYWFSRSNPYFTSGNDIQWNGIIWVAVGTPVSNNTSIVYSTDGINWATPTQGNLFSTSGTKVAWSGTTWVAVGNDPSNNVATSVDGKSWTMIAVASLTYPPTAVYADKYNTIITANDTSEGSYKQPIVTTTSYSNIVCSNSGIIAILPVAGDMPYVSTDSLNNWVRPGITCATPKTGYSIGCGITYNNGGNLYVIDAGNGWVNIYNNSSWTQTQYTTSTNTSITSVSTFFLGSLTRHLIYMVGTYADAGNSNAVNAGGQDSGLFISTDSGSTWAITEIKINGDYYFAWDVAAAEASGNVYVVASKKTVPTTSTNNNYILKYNSGSWSIVKTLPDEPYSNPYFTDYSNNWGRMYVSTSPNGKHIYASRPNGIYTNYIYSSDDFGATWTDMSYAVSAVYPSKIIISRSDPSYSTIITGTSTNYYDYLTDLYPVVLPVISYNRGKTFSSINIASVLPTPTAKQRVALSGAAITSDLSKMYINTNINGTSAIYQNNATASAGIVAYTMYPSSKMVVIPSGKNYTESTLFSNKVSRASAIINNGFKYIIGGSSIQSYYGGSLFDASRNGYIKINGLAANNSNKGVANIPPMTIACGEGNASLAYSYDGIIWNPVPKSLFSKAYSVAWNGKLWVAVGDSSGTTNNFWVATSYDGVNWTGSDNTATRMTVGRDIEWNGKVFVAVGSNASGGAIATSPDGFKWTTVTNISSLFSTSVYSIAWTGRVWLAYGSGTNTTAYSTLENGSVWSPTPSPNLINASSDSKIKPIILKNAVLHPGTTNTYQLTDLCLNLISNNNINGNTINPVIYGAGTGFVTGSTFDGQNHLVTTSDGSITYLSNTASITNLVFDNSYNGSTLSSGLTAAYASCYNTKFIILGGTGSSPITYNVMNNTPISTWYSTNTSSIFTTVYGLGSNSRYGPVVCPNTIYMTQNDSLSLVTPKFYNQSMIPETSVTFNYKPIV